MKRSEQWPHMLREYLDHANGRMFAWGVSDCCTLVCDWIRLATGQDVYAEFRGRYSDASAAARVIREVTGAGVTVAAAAEYITAKYGMAEVAPKLAQRGDVVLFDGTNGPMLGLVSLHPAQAVFLQERGLLRLRTDACQRAWRV